ncbi:MAG: CHAT domain-containing protein [Blastocatellia bacterium]
MAARIALLALLALLLNASLLALPSQLALKQKPAEPSPDRASDRESEAEALHQQAMQLIETGQYGLAHARLFEAVRHWRQAHQSERAIRALLHLAEDDRKAYRLQAALQCYRRVLQLPALPGQVKASALNSVAQLYTLLHQYPLAAEYYQQALRLARRLKDRRDETDALIGLATVGAEQGLVEQARAYLEQARQLAEQARDEKAVAATLALVGRTYRAQGQMAPAREATRQALWHQRQTHDQEGETQSLCLLSELDLTSNQPQAALEQAARAVALANQLKVSELQWRAYLELARSQRALDRAREAINSYFRAVGFIEKQRLLYFSTDAFKITLLAERQAPYRELADLLIERGRADEAFEIIEHARSRATLDLLATARRRAAPLRSLASNVALRDLAQRIARLRAELRSAPLDGRQQTARQAELAEAEQRLEEARWEAEMERFNHFARPATLKEAQRVVQPQEALLEFFLGEKRSYVWLISAEEVRWAALPGQQEIEEKIRPYLETLGAKPRRSSLEREVANQKRLGEQLFNLLLGQFAERLAASQQLTIAPDGLLYYLPFETLIHDGHYLIEQYEIRYIPSVSVLSLLPQSREPAVPQAQMELLAFGDPVFVPLPKTTNHTKIPSGNLNREFWSSTSLRLPPLPNTRAEALFISEPFPPERKQLYLGRAATEEAFKREPLDRYRRLHFATHSLIDEQFPARSGVVLALADDPQEAQEAQEDGLLEVAEIAELKLDCDLVVLSACQTGRGQLVRGEGIVGLTRAFLYAGARSVAVSLWNVSDLSTARLMRSFYRHLAAGTGAAAALRQAKLEMLDRNNVTRHPYYWAPFVLVGNPQ